MATRERANGAAKEFFIDTSGFFALLCSRDSAHQEAKRCLGGFAKARRKAITSDYVLDETFSLLKARGMMHLSKPLLDLVATSKSLRVEWTQPARFDSAVTLFLRRLDQGYSFTDCVSFSIMRELGLRDALTTDHHFRIAGFVPLLNVS